MKEDNKVSDESINLINNWLDAFRIDKKAASPWRNSAIIVFLLFLIASCIRYVFIPSPKVFSENFPVNLLNIGLFLAGGLLGMAWVVGSNTHKRKSLQQSRK